MIEAVGHHFLIPTSILSQRLKPDGLALIQAITIVEQRYQIAVNSVDFIKRYIFPGGFIPSIGSIMQSVGRASDLRLLHLEDFASHYARTLAAWRKRFTEEKDRILRLGYDERFVGCGNSILHTARVVFMNGTGSGTARPREAQSTARSKSQ